MPVQIVAAHKKIPSHIVFMKIPNKFSQTVAFHCGFHFQKCRAVSLYAIFDSFDMY